MIASSNHTHVDLLPDALSSGLPILVEKPLCTTAPDCEAAGLSGQRAFCPDGLRWSTVTCSGEHAGSVIEGRKIGAMKMLSITEHRFPFLKKVGDWNRFPKLRRNAGGKMLSFFDLMRLLTRANPSRFMLQEVSAVIIWMNVMMEKHRIFSTMP